VEQSAFGLFHERLFHSRHRPASCRSRICAHRALIHFYNRSRVPTDALILDCKRLHRASCVLEHLERLRSNLWQLAQLRAQSFGLVAFRFLTSREHLSMGFRAVPIRFR
jgi:Ni,Fe-hydrogenase III large subunit